MVSYDIKWVTTSWTHGDRQFIYLLSIGKNHDLGTWEGGARYIKNRGSQFGEMVVARKAPGRLYYYCVYSHTIICMRPY